MKYPGLLEHVWREEARRIWGFLPEEQLVERIRPHVQRLSDRFTTDRGAALEPYGDDAESRLAYGLFFFPQTFMRAAFVLDECWIPQGDGPLRILDLGAGSGAAGFAALHRLGARPARLRAVDRSSGSLETLARVAASCREMWSAASVEIEQGDVAHESGRDESHDLILCSFALNELVERDPAFDCAAWVRRLMKRLAPAGVLVIVEPALKASSERLEALRDHVIGWPTTRILGPCQHHARCPMRADGRHWCHEVRRWTPPPLAALINRTLFRDLPHLKFSFLALTPGRGEDVEPTATRARLVAPVMEQRGKFVTRGCAADGQLYDYELLTRHLTGEQWQAIAETERGARVRWSDLKQLGNGALRAASMEQPPALPPPAE